jgi:hypothetical protein
VASAPGGYEQMLARARAQKAGLPLPPPPAAAAPAPNSANLPDSRQNSNPAGAVPMPLPMGTREDVATMIDILYERLKGGPLSGERVRKQLTIS